MLSVKKTVLLTLLSILANFAFSQVDSLENKSVEPQKIKKEKKGATFELADSTELKKNKLLPEEELELNSPTKAALMAAAVPGLGQVYNKKYWKVPMVYGGFVVFASLIDFNNVRWALFRDALAAKTEDEDAILEDSRLQNYSTDQLRRARDSYRRDRDLNIILTFAWYGLTIADAVVDAHLSKFNVNEDLSAKLRPGIIENDFNNQPMAGVKFVVYLHPKH
ncbi:DUF5683 domain-containing protein [Chondrinema litorale]|uniref:DUF5683 domain-containing protein n=1 Tax=Chondrinema litorale TaxID=2994555 RepID=UPI002543F4FD|nr:DUF5683 domain-containing protein [Chondrinema litorale]UZR94742.1 DUF5683 domain-containing protein [Chondrinema litorale]